MDDCECEGCDIIVSFPEWARVAILRRSCKYGTDTEYCTLMQSVLHIERERIGRER